MLAESAYSGLPDKRLKERFAKIVESFSEAAEQSIPQALRRWGEVKAAYRFFDNERVSHEQLMMGQREATRERINQRGETTVLLVQDTTSFSFKHHPATAGMGPVENAHTAGFLAHSSLAVSSSGVPLGLVEQQVWVRDPAETGKSHQRHEREFRDKESYKWVEGLPRAEAEALAQQVVTISDREAHIYEYMDMALQQGLDFIVRAARGRSFSLHRQEIFAVLAEMPVQHRYTIHLKAHPQRDARQAQLELRYGSVELQRPRRAQTQRQSLTVQVVEVIEPHPPVGQKAVHWLLLTSLAVETLPQAEQVVEWYSYRWLIERFHYVLKSGCRLEERQLQTQARLERLLGVFNVVAWRLLWLTYQARHTPDASCLVALTSDEWQALYAHHHRTTQLPETPPTLHQATRWIAQLGGFLARKGDGEPGVKVLWRGWARLQDIADTWRLLHPPPQDVGKA